MIILKNATGIQFNPAQVFKNIDIVIENSYIKELGKNIADKYKECKTIINLNEDIVFPGLVCSHNHFYSGLARGITASIKPSFDFASILTNLWWRLDRSIDEEILYYSGLTCSLDAIKSGTTSVIDHHASPSFIKGSLNTLKKGFEKVGLRAMTCYEVTDRNGIKQMEEGVKENISFAKEIDYVKAKKTRPYLVEASIGAHAPFTLSDKALSLLSDAIKQTNRGIHIHAAEDSYDGSYSHATYGKDLLERLNDFKLLNNKSIIVHGVNFLDNDIEILNKTDSFLVHNPRSNMNNGVGYSEKLAKIKNLALGTDGITSNMFEEIKFAYFKHKDDKGSFWPDDFLKFLANGNTILEANFNEKFGKLKPGYKADLVISDYIAPTPINKNNLAGHMVFGMNSDNVKTVIIDGKIVYEDRKFPFDIKAIYKKAQKQAEKLWKNMDKLGRCHENKK